jgi:hypothetical protein
LEKSARGGARNRSLRPRREALVSLNQFTVSDHPAPTGNQTINTRATILPHHAAFLWE